MTWQTHLLERRKQQLQQIEFLSSGKVRLHVTENDTTRDVTDERLDETRQFLTEIEQILRQEGVPFGA